MRIIIALIAIALSSLAACEQLNTTPADASVIDEGEHVTMLPKTRNRTYDTSTPVNPQDMNDLQDMHVGDKHTTRTTWVSLTDGRCGGGASDNGFYVTFASIGSCYKSVQLIEGERIIGIKIKGHHEDGVSVGKTINAELCRVVDIGTVVVIGTVSFTSNGSDVAAIVEHTLAVPEIVSAANNYFFNVSTADTGVAYSIAVVTDKL